MKQSAVGFCESLGPALINFMDEKLVLETWQNVKKLFSVERRTCYTASSGR